MQIAIIGAGFAGVALTYHLKKYASVEVTLFDESGIGAGASGASSGLLHPFSGANCRRTWMSDEGMKATNELITEVEKLGKAVCRKEGILRPALTQTQLSLFHAASLKHPDTLWLSKEETEKKIPYLQCLGSLFIPQGITLFPLSYLQGLWILCENLGAVFKKESISSLDTLHNFDAIVITAGSFSCTLFPSLALRKTKGQMLQLEWPQKLPLLPCSLVSHVYLTRGSTDNSCFLGATYERGVQSREVDIKAAEYALLPKAYELIPQLRHSKTLQGYCGFRAFAKDNITPIAGKTGQAKTWVFSGLGSKGLLHHAWIAQLLAQAIIEDEIKILPYRLYRFL